MSATFVGASSVSLALELDPDLVPLVEQKKEPTHFKGSIIRPQTLAKTLGLSGDESKEWTTALNSKPKLPILYCAATSEVLGTGEQAVMAWFRRGSPQAPFEWRIVKYGEKIPLNFYEVEIYEIKPTFKPREAKEYCQQWRDRFLVCLPEWSRREDSSRPVNDGSTRRIITDESAKEMIVRAKQRNAVPGKPPARKNLLVSNGNGQ